MDALKRFAAAAVLLVGTLLLGFAANAVLDAGAASKTGYDSVAALMEELPLEQTVRVTANVTAVLDDYESDSGNTYQQFRVSNGEKEVLIFCGTWDGRVDVATGDRVTVTGTFQEYYDTYEIYTQCASIRTGG